MVSHPYVKLRTGDFVCHILKTKQNEQLSGINDLKSDESVLF